MEGLALARECPGRTSLADVLGALLGPAAEIVLDASSPLFHLDPLPRAMHAIDRARSADPSLVVAADFLFWLAYGSVGAGGDTERVRRLEAGLKALERLPAPLIVGDLPDASNAIGRALSREQVPAPRSLDALNQRIRDWAARRASVVVIPLSTLAHAWRARGSTEAAGDAGDNQGDPAWIRADRLHLTARGLVELAREVIASARALDAKAGVPESLPGTSDVLARLAASCVARPSASQRDRALRAAPLDAR